MDSTRNGFDDFFDYNLYESEHGPQQPDGNLVQHQSVLDQAMVVWNELKLQISNFNKIIVVPDATFEAWSEADQTQVADFMAMETTHSDISYAIDPTLPDRVYLGSMVHFDDVGILLYDFPDYALPVMVAKAPQIPNPAPYPAPAPAPAMPTPAQVDFSVSHSNGGGALPVQASPA
ncbi:hypothetical protein UCREL1_4345 [Eutypa lata UCREL1]|uniref:Uncharacterized protein n=1 Tax=Eutypa lata (strain UCR-EL1) TaxID=1287681 RepID=M7TPP4_EUTLA|nr:hypothetical protein UCREL1_4345 [Eutypa lata UCREL1]